MHLLAATAAPIGEGAEAIDLAQPPGDVCILSAADSELAALAAAYARLADDMSLAAPARQGERESATASAPFSLRLASLLQLRHHLSVDMWLENTARHAKLIIARVLGGHAYWPHGVEELQRLAAERGIALVLLPGGNVVDEELMARSTLPPALCEGLRQLFAAGGVENARRVLLTCAELLRKGVEAAHEVVMPPPLPFPAAGAWLDGEVITDVAQVLARLSMPASDDGQTAVAPVIFYRALLEGGFTAPVAALARALKQQGLVALPLFVGSLKEATARAFLGEVFAALPLAVIVNATAFAAGEHDPLRGAVGQRQPDCAVLQALFSGADETSWRNNPQGLGPRDLAMLVSLPELDGRIIARAASFKESAAFDEATHCRLTTYRPHAAGIAHIAELAARHARLRALRNGEKRIALVLANYPNRDSRIGNGVGLDTPASTLNILRALAAAGYAVDADRLPENGDALIAWLMQGPSNAQPRRATEAVLALKDYLNHFNALPEEAREPIQQRWGVPQDDPFFRDGGFALPLRFLGEGVICAIQPARGYNIDPKATYHDPALPPPHGYLAFYFWLRHHFRADAVVHVGKHGNMEWLPGKALALSEACFPQAVLGAMPHFYPFIVNDPGEGAQAKRRTQAAVIDHLMPPLARAETHGALAELERLVDEYWQASGLDAARCEHLREEILLLAQSSGIAEDAGVADLLRDDPEAALGVLDAWLCDLKEAQIRGGLHVLGELAEADALAETLVALARMPRGDGKGEHASIIAALADDLLGEGGFDVFDADMAAPFEGARPALLAEIDSAPWRSNGDTRERLEMLALKLVREMLEATSLLSSSLPEPIRQSGSASTAHAAVDARVKPGHDNMGRRNEKRASAPCSNELWPAHSAAAPQGEREEEAQWLARVRRRIGPRTAAVLAWMRAWLLEMLARSTEDEIANLLRGLEGRFVPPGPSGAPSRGRLDVLPTGRNFFSLDARSLPTPAAWALGQRSARNMIQRHFMEHGEYPRAIGLSCWGTSNMRTGGDDIAQALALIGAKPVWDHASGRVTGFEIMPLAALGRPRVDVTLRISGFFRDAFPQQIELFDAAIRAIGALDEPEADNPIAARMGRRRAELIAQGLDEQQAERMAGFRIFGARPGAYGAGLQALFDENLWETQADLAETWIEWGGHAYGAREQGTQAKEALRQQLAGLDAIAHNQDNREHDILDSDDYYQFEGGFAVAAAHVQGRRVPVWHNDHSRPDAPVTRSLEEEIARVIRARASNPKWITAMMRHGYKGAFELAATMDYTFAFATTTAAVKSHHFEALFDAWLRNDDVREWLAEHNAEALADIAARFEEAMARGFWRPRGNDAMALLEGIRERNE